MQYTVSETVPVDLTAVQYLFFYECLAFILSYRSQAS